MAYASITDLATWEEGFIGSYPSSFGSNSMSGGIVFVLLVGLVAFSFLFQYAMRLPGPPPLVYVMESSSGLIHIIFKHFVWCKSSASFHSFTLHSRRKVYYNQHNLGDIKFMTI
jgi:hypothetical protein